MSSSGKTPLERYLEMREAISARASELFDRYASQVRCRRGCWFCCDEITVLPIELEALRAWLSSNRVPEPSRPDGTLHPPARRSVDRSRHGVFPSTEAGRPRCAFLGSAGECTVYGGRPVICRTHGLPLAYRVYEYDIQGREVAPEHPEYTDLWCDLNFPDLAEESAPAYFDANGRINMDEVNARIDTLNAEFLQTDGGEPYRNLPPGEERLPLKVLIDGPTPRAHPSSRLSDARDGVTPPPRRE